MPSAAALEVLINAVSVPGSTVVADLTVRSGRTRADDGLEAASATIDLLSPDPAGVVVGVGDDLQVKVNGAPRFTGRIAEVTRATAGDPASSLYTLVGIGQIARLARILVNLPMAAGSAADRAVALFQAAGIPYVVQGGHTLQMAAYGATGDPPTTADQVAGALMIDTGCILQDQGDGSVLVQFLDSRLGGLTFAPDPADTHVDLAWEQTDDLVNDAQVAWSAGTATASDAASITTYDRHTVRLQTGLGDVSSATRRCNSIVARLAHPAWRLGDVQTWDDGILAQQVGTIVQLAPLPASSPVGDHWSGVLEGWVDRYQPSVDGVLIGTWDLAVADLQHSAETLTWAGVDPATLPWNQVNPATSWSEAITNEDLQ